jgi:23S rRNA (cytidine2498-2'-O)-methyltransferase
LSEFVWLLHQPAVVGWVKREIAERRPDLKFAFSRPGLTTFRGEGPVLSSFARAHGVSIGRATSAAEILALLPLAGRSAAASGSAAAGQRGGIAGMRLHVFERDVDRPADERDRALVGSRAAALDAELRASGRFADGVEARAGELVLDVICAPAEEEAEPMLVGTHVHDRTHGPFPGGVAHVAIPAAAPSRAWAKIEEAIRWSGLAPRPGETAVEIGSSPGGASFALLERGLVVHGIDPGVMHPTVMAHPKFTHHAQPAAEVPKSALPRKYQWLASDVNLAPMVALKYVERMVALAHGGLRGAFITLKLNDDGVFEALPRLRERIAKMGAADVRYTQLPSHRSEIVAIMSW